MQDFVANMDPMERAQIELGNQLQQLKDNPGYEAFLSVIRARFDEAFEALLIPNATEITIWESIGALKLSRKLETALDEEVSRGHDALERYVERYEAEARAQNAAAGVEPEVRRRRQLTRALG